MSRGPPGLSPHMMQSNYRAPYMDPGNIPASTEYLMMDSSNSPRSDSTTSFLALKEGGRRPAFRESTPRTTRTSRRRLFYILLGCGLLLLAAGAAAIVYFVVIKPRNHESASSDSANSSSSSPSPAIPTNSTTDGQNSPQTPLAITGGHNSSIRLANGTVFTYENNFGGIWYSDPDDPYNNNAYPNSWTPPLNQSWDWEKNKINGVNLGGWFVLEPFITPNIFQRYPGAIDEWTLSTLMAADTANGGLNQLEDHYKTFITEQDIAKIAAAGLNWIRLPIPFWAVDIWDGEPFLAKTSWPYIVQALQWCRKYGLRVKLDLHTIPGSQNGYNHSGKNGQIDFLKGTMGMANAQRTLNYIRIITEFISQPEWKDVVLIFGVMNEALVAEIGRKELGGFYMETYKMIRGITGVGAGKGPYIAIHDAMQGLPFWVSLMPGADRVIIDQHPYMAFDMQANLAPIDTGVGPGAGGTWPTQACKRWGAPFDLSRSQFGVTIAGEFSNAINDCGTYVRGIGNPTISSDCALWTDSSKWTEGTKSGLLAFSQASMDALQDWFFWTWKIGPAQSGIVEAPLWSYSLGLDNGWMPTDPRAAQGACGSSIDKVFSGTFAPWQLGGNGAGVIDPAQDIQFPFPPTDLQGTPVSALPLYTSTGSIATLPAPTFTGTSGKLITSPGNGWFNKNDAQPGPAPISGCSYPDAWNATAAPIPTGCSGGDNAAVPATITPPPSRR